MIQVLVDWVIISHLKIYFRIMIEKIITTTFHQAWIQSLAFRQEPLLVAWVWKQWWPFCLCCFSLPSLQTWGMTTKNVRNLFAQIVLLVHVFCLWLWLFYFILFIVLFYFMLNITLIFYLIIVFAITRYSCQSSVLVVLLSIIFIN